MDQEEIMDSKIFTPIEHARALQPSKRKERPEVSYKTNARYRFYVEERTFHQQFYHLYVARTKRLREEIRHSLLHSTRFKKYTIADSVLKLDMSLGKCIVIGTLYKSQKLKPNILLEYTKERFVEEVGNALGFDEDANRTSESDFLIMEDEYGRARLTFAHDTVEQVGKYVTGMVVACLGEENEAGDFVVDEVIYSGMAPQPSLPSNLDRDVYVAFISGISIGHKLYKPALLQMAVDYMAGVAGCIKEQQAILSQIARVIVVGNSVSPLDVQKEMFGTRGSLRAHDKLSMVGSMKQADQFFAQLGNSMHVDIMPGNKDPSNQALPQTPLHHSLLPSSRKLSTIHLATNPHSFDINGVHMLGISGESVQNIKHLSTRQNTLEIMDHMLRYRHLAPTAPDTLNCYPFQEEDPFIIETTPHVFFVGNESQYESKLVKGENGQTARLISVPSFVNTSTIVLVNLRTLQSHPIQFDVDVL